MNNPTYLIYPTVDLFLYDLQEGLGQDGKQTYINRRQFWRKFDPEFDKQLQELADFDPQKAQTGFVVTETIADRVRNQVEKFKELENSEVDYKKLYDKSFAEPYLDGHYFALQLGDTYALQVDCSDVTEDKESPKRSDALRPIENLKDLKKLLVSKINHHSNDTEIEPNRQGTIGQTWLVWGKLTDNKTAKEVAQECDDQLTPNPKWKSNLTELGELLGATVFEYSHSPANWVENWEKFSQENYHLIICLFPNDATPTDELRKKMASVYFDLIRLFCYRHKIVWAYWKSRHLKKELKQKNDQINELIGKIEQFEAQGINLKELQSTIIKSLPSVSKYVVDLNRLDTQSRTIKINLENYKKRWEKIEEDGKITLKNWQDFITTAEERYLQQVDMDHASLSAGLTLLENLLRTIGNIAEIQQTKSDRTLNKTVAAAGIGLATSQVTSAVILAQPPLAKHPVGVAVGSLGIGAIVGVLIFVILRGFHR
ncbi:MAG: hypothetical protein U7127_15065 [Phormidium sp.]